MSVNRDLKEDKKTRKPRLFFTGLTMGLADLVPGVSGGTIALLMGIYDELLYTIKLVTGEVPKLFLTGNFKKAFKLLPFGFLIPLGLGLATAIFGLVHLVSYLLESQTILVWAFFFGLVLGSAYVVSHRILNWTMRSYLLLIIGFLLTYILVGLPSVGGSSAPLVMFGTGAIAITAMILPGISGSLILVLLGQYEIIINAVANRNILTLIYFALGAIGGLAIFVRLLTWLLKNYHFSVIAFLVGVMIGSLRRIWPWQIENINGQLSNTIPALNMSFYLAIILAVVGFLVVFMLEKAGVAREHVDIDTKDFKQEYKEIEENLE